MEELRDILAQGCRLLGAGDQNDLIWGHLSARDPEGRGAWMKASGFSFDEITSDRTVLVGWSGEVLAGDQRRHAEYPIHTEILARRDDVGAVVHTHSRAAVALGATGHPLQPVSHEATLFTPPDIPRFRRTSDLILTSEAGRGLAEDLGDRNAALMVNHGLVVAARSIETAVVSTILLDAACRMQLDVLAAGGAAHVTGDEEALSKRRNCYGPNLLQQAWEYLVRQLPPATR